MLVMAQMLKEISQEKEILIFMINLKNSSNTSEGNRVFGVSDKFSKHDVSLTSGKHFGYPKQMHATYRVTKDHNYGINQTPRETPVHCSWRIQCRYLQQQIHAERETNSYQTKIKLSQQSLAELKWWKENLLLQNSKLLKIGMAQLIIQMDASKTSWG